MKLRHAAALVAVLALAVGGYAYWTYRPPLGDWLKQIAGRGELATPQPRAVPVTVEEVGTGVAERTYRAVGEIVADEKVHLTSEVSALVDEILVQDGERVDRGQLLVQLDDSQARARLQAARARAEEARAQFLRARALVERDFITAAELDERKATLVVARADVAQAEADVADHAIRAPFAGEVGFILLSPGALIEPGQSVVHLSTTERLRVRFAVPEREGRSVEVGQTVRLAAGANGMDGLEGRVATVAPTIDPASRSRTIEATLDDRHANLAPGQFVEVILVIERRPDSLFVPETALVREGMQSFVYRITEDGTAERQAVEVGVRRNGRVEVVSGLQAGQRVATGGLQKLADGVPVSATGASGDDSGQQGRSAGRP